MNEEIEDAVSSGVMNRRIPSKSAIFATLCTHRKKKNLRLAPNERWLYRNAGFFPLAIVKTTSRSRFCKEPQKAMNDEIEQNSYLSSERTVTWLSLLLVKEVGWWEEQLAPMQTRRGRVCPRCT